MSSIARMTTASTPSSPTHCGVVEFGKAARDVERIVLVQIGQAIAIRGETLAEHQASIASSEQASE